MKERAVILMVMLGTSIAACGDHHLDPVDIPPSAPTGVYSVTGDGRVTLYWNPNPEIDIDGYAVYSGLEELGRYELEGTTPDTYYTVHIPNGVTRYFAVAAVDFFGNESELSYETVWDTPRPEGHSLPVYALLYDSLDTNADRCGIDFSDYADVMVQALENPSNDIYVDKYEGVLYINAFDDDTDVAEFGYAGSLYDIDYVDPELTEWDLEGYCALHEDFAYIVWTWDNHFAAVRVLEVYQDMVILEWAYQTDQGNPQLKIAGGKRREGDRSLKFRVPKESKESKNEIPTTNKLHE